MARITVEDCLTEVPNRFALVLLVGKRVKQMLKGSNPTVAVKDNKQVVMALREVAAGRVRFDTTIGEGTADDQIVRDLSR